MKAVNIAPFLNQEGQIILMPVKAAPRAAVLRYLAGKFQPDRDYTEKEVNAICEQWHTFGDYFLLRRELVDQDLLRRERDGSRYWRNEEEQEIESRREEVTGNGQQQKKGIEGTI